MRPKYQRKLDEHIAALVYESRIMEYASPLEAGDEVTVNIRFGDEGPGGSWTRIEGVTVEPRHIKQAKELEQRIEGGRF